MGARLKFWVALGVVLLLAMALSGCAPPPPGSTHPYKMKCLNGVQYYEGPSGALAPAYTPSARLIPCGEDVR